MNDHEAMEAALAEARETAEAGEVPIGAVVLHEGAILARGQTVSCALSILRPTPKSSLSAPPAIPPVAPPKG